ncbi:MAG: DUF1987 domain-containing protein [Bacteroidales bacterium]|nr:DUF1987 domain-containing protein [Bacteroidales bacterium]
MKNLFIEKTSQKPEINFNPETGILAISGRSLPEDSSQFYKPVMDWLKIYFEQPYENTKLVFKMDYFNTASAKAIFSIFNKCEMQFKEGLDISVEWWYDKDDEDMKELGDEYVDLFTMPIQLLKN